MDTYGVEVYVEPGEAIAYHAGDLVAAVLDKVNADEYFIAYVIPSGYTPVDAGIVFSENGVPSVESSDSKASVKQAAGMGQFTAAPGDDSHTAARGYVMYKDNATGDIRVIYSK